MYTYMHGHDEAWIFYNCQKYGSFVVLNTMGETPTEHCK